MADKTSDELSSSPGPPAGRKETLTARARRFIGRPLNTSDDTSPPAQSSRRGAKKSPTRRREQVLQAQRTHRQRTQGYIRELEKEVLRLRERETTLQTENEKLTSLLLTNGIPFPDSMGDVVVQHQLLTPNTSISSPRSEVSSAAPSIMIDLTALATTSPTYGCGFKAAMSTPPQFEAPSKPPPEIPFQTQFMADTGGSSRKGTKVYSPVITPQLGIDFVLELEKPCLAHVKYRYAQDYTFDPSKYPEFDVGPGHVFMATTSLVNSQYAEDPINQTFQVPPVDIDNLFQTSLSLDLGPDVTPIQIWENIKRISMQYVLDEVIVQGLRDEFKKYFRCNSFGAVIEKDTASAVLSFYFPGEEFSTYYV